MGKRIISVNAAKETTSMMVEAAQRGESKWTNITGFRVAGKTGTAQIPIAGHYDSEKTIASFIGFELIAKVPPTLHTPLMSGSNAVSGITIACYNTNNS